MMTSADPSMNKISDQDKELAERLKAEANKLFQSTQILI
jgi:hypothetical protein